MQNLIDRNIHLVKGKVAKRAHVGLPEDSYEEEWGRLGFSGPIAHIYHKNPPTGWSNIEGPLRPHALSPLEMAMDADTRVPFLQNADVAMHMMKVSSEWDWFFRNADAEEVYFVHTGAGRIETQLGHFTYEVGDYLHFPKGTTYRFIPAEDTTMLLVEAFNGPLQQPTRGVLGQHALYDPASVVYPEPELGDHYNSEWRIRIKREDEITTFTYPQSPCDVIGWKGDLAPFKLNIREYCPVNSHKMHLPPPVHTTFVGAGFIICSFLPRPLETDPEAVKVPFYHSNIDYDEVIFYHDGDFFSRSGIDKGMVTLHPGGFPHGPHPKAVRRTDTKTFTDESAVMLDTRRPLHLTPEGEAVEFADYWKSWQE